MEQNDRSLSYEPNLPALNVTHSPVIDPLGDMHAKLPRPVPVTYGCCSESCSIKSFVFWLAAGPGKNYTLSK